MKRAKVSEFKTHLSSYLAEVRGGASIIVCDRNTPIARLGPYDEGHGLLIRDALRPISDLRKIRGVKVVGPQATDLLRQDRNQR